MFERLTDRSRRAVTLAHDEARSLNHTYLGTEHLLLGLLQEGEGAAAKALESFGVSSERIRREIEEIIGRGDHPSPVRMSFTPRVKTVFEVALREAALLGHPLVGTEHLLLGLIRDRDGVAAQVTVGSVIGGGCRWLGRSALCEYFEMAWPVDWDERVAGSVCSLCAEGRPEDTKYGRRIAVGELTDAYLARRGLVRGYAIVVWRGEHLIEPTDLSAADAATYNAEVLRVGRAIQLLCRPMKMNYQTLGNWSPHLHTHVTARYRDDVAPGKPLPAGPNVDRPEAEWLADVSALSVLLGTES